MTVKSSGPVISQLDSTELVNANAIALYQTGVEMLDLWHLPEAVHVFELIVRDDPSHLQARLRLVEAYAHPMIRKERRARESWSVARRVAIRAGYDTLLVAAFGSLFVEDDPLKAIDEFRTIMEKDPQSESARFLLAQSLLAARQPRRAEAILTEMLDADPSQGRVREMLVRCSAALGKLPEAESRSRELASLYTSEPYPYVLLSRVLLLEGKIEEAAEFGNNALVIDEKYIPAILGRAHVYIAENELMAARVSFEKLLLFGDSMLSSAGMEGISYVGFLSGQFDEASDYMDDAIRLAMSAGSTRQGLRHAFRLVGYLCELGRTDAAASVVDRWIQRHGEIPASLGQLRVRISMGQSQRARQALNQIKDNQKWRYWMRSLELDYNAFKALTFIHDENFDRAQDILNIPVVVGLHARRSYLKGFVAFQRGEAEEAAGFFGE
ncbi:MAG: tetratricopeptide repeat protein, partial [bacterium]|nr:tetratricopeptide repeat protein [bacterium]